MFWVYQLNMCVCYVVVLVLLASLRELKLSDPRETLDV